MQGRIGSRAAVVARTGAATTGRVHLVGRGRHVVDGGRRYPAVAASATSASSR